MVFGCVAGYTHGHVSQGTGEQHVVDSIDTWGALTWFV